MVTGPAVPVQTQPCDRVLILVFGGDAQCVLSVHDHEVELGFALAGKNCALTSTGITAPVFKLNGICPRTLSVLAISPEWEVIEIQV